MKFLALLALLLTTACAPVYVTAPAAGDGQLLPEQIQRAADAYTATARTIATQAAGATATGVSARETATAASLGTLDALAVRQTEVGLSLTLAAGQGQATAAAGLRTESAQATAAWATPTAAAMRAQATAQAAEDARQLAQAETVGEFWRTFRTIVIVLVVVAGLTACAVVAFDRMSAVHIARLAKQAAIAREAFRILPPHHWAEWQPGDGYRVYALPGGVEEPAPTVIEHVPTQPNRAHEWRQAVRLFAHYGDKHGFGINELGAAGAGVVTDPAWRTLTKLLKGAGVLAEASRAGQRGRVTQWAPEWDHRRFRDELASGRLVLPFPADADAPKVAFTVPTEQAI